MKRAAKIVTSTLSHHYDFTLKTEISHLFPEEWKTSRMWDMGKRNVKKQKQGTKIEGNGMKPPWAPKYNYWANKLTAFFRGMVWCNQYDS